MAAGILWNLLSFALIVACSIVSSTLAALAAAARCNLEQLRCDLEQLRSEPSVSAATAYVFSRVRRQPMWTPVANPVNPIGISDPADPAEEEGAQSAGGGIPQSAGGVGGLRALWRHVTSRARNRSGGPPPDSAVQTEDPMGDPTDPILGSVSAEGSRGAMAGDEAGDGSSSVPGWDPPSSPEGMDSAISPFLRARALLGADLPGSESDASPYGAVDGGYPAAEAPHVLWDAAACAVEDLNRRVQDVGSTPDPHDSCAFRMWDPHPIPMTAACSGCGIHTRSP